MDISAAPVQSWYELGPFTVFDTETTGLSARFHRIVEIAAIRIDTDGTRTTFHSLIHPERRIPRAVTMIHGITDEMVKDAPPFGILAHDFISFVQGSVLVAHNARFDLAFLQESLVRSGHPPWDGKTLDTIPLIKTAFPGLPNYKLQYLRQRFGLGRGTETAHRAFGDVEITVEAFSLTLQTLIQNQKQV